MNTLTLNYQDFITTNDNEPKTTSLKVAEAFGKRHTHVLRSIKNMDCSPEFTSAHFWAHIETITMPNGGTRESTYYEMTKDGFMFLVMGFTGKAAAQVKEAYINAFNWMTAQLLNKQKQPQITTSAISDEQAGILFNIVATRTGKNGKLRAEMWGRLKKHFKYASYLKLKAIHFDEAKLILETMELHGDMKALPAPIVEHKAAYHDQHVQFLMWYLPKLAKLIRDDIYPALNLLGSSQAGMLIGLSHEAACHVNLLNMQAIKNGMVTLEHVGDRPVPTLHNYLNA